MELYRSLHKCNHTYNSNITCSLIANNLFIELKNIISKPAIESPEGKKYYTCFEEIDLTKWKYNCD